MEKAKELSRQAEHCRSTARTVSDQRTRVILETMAVEFDRQAKEEDDRKGIESIIACHVREADMSRKYIDCREFPSESNCTVAISADSEDELIDAAAQHAVQVHGHQDSPELRAQLKEAVRESETVA